jgi:ParB family chromosome partitioning protein
LGRGDSPPTARPARTHPRQAARLVTGNAGYKRLEQLTALQRWTTDPRQAPAIRQMAVAELAQIQAGAPVQAAFDRVRHAIATTRAAETTAPRAAEDVVALQLERLAAQAVERIKTEQRTGHKTKRTSRPKHRTPRWFVLTWTELDGWTNTVDLDELATTLTDKECDLFRRVLAETERFAELLEAARSRGSTEQ